MSSPFREKNLNGSFCPGFRVSKFTYHVWCIALSRIFKEVPQRLYVCNYCARMKILNEFHVGRHEIEKNLEVEHGQIFPEIRNVLIRKVNARVSG